MNINVFLPCKRKSQRVPNKNKRNAVLIELNSDYIDIAEDRIHNTLRQKCLDI